MVAECSAACRRCDAERRIPLQRLHCAGVTSLPLAVSTLGIVIVIVAALAVLFLIGGLIAVRVRNRQQGGAWKDHVAAADAALESARALDKGWHRDTMEAAAKAAVAESRPELAAVKQLHLVLVDDRPGTEEDRAQFVAVCDGGEARVILARDGDRWVAERVE
jgi:hypothetical protein